MNYYSKEPGKRRLLRIIFLLQFFTLCFASTELSPRISEHPLDILVAKGDPATLRCASNGDNVEINWYKDGEQVKVGNGHRLLLPNGSLFLLKVNSGGTDSDAGTYYCVARNEHGQVQSQEANVKIAMLREDFRVNPHAVQVLLNQNAVLECSPPKGFPEPSTSWKKDEKELNLMEDSRIKLHPSGNLIIENVQRSDGGFYQCIARNMVGDRVSKPAKLSVYEKPRFLAEPKDTIADLNSSVLFDCRVAGEPMPSISWKKRNEQMPIGRAYVTKDSRGLRIDRVQADDAGEYVCYAKNPVGNIESTAKLRVNSPPSFTKSPENVRLNAGRTAVFDCEAAGQPQPGIFWSKEGDQHFTFFSGLISSDGRIQVTKEGRLLIDNVRAIDQGNYVCAAVNAAGSTLAKASLTVINSANPSFPPPVIQYGHQNQTLMVNDMAIMPCQAMSRVPATITWLKNGELMNLSKSEDGSRFQQLVTGTLRISDLSKSDTGVYTCRAKNEDGEATWTASLIVDEHTNPNTMFQRMPDAAVFPSAPGKPVALNSSEETVELEWSPPEKHGASPIIGYILQYWSAVLGESWQNVMDVVPSTPRFRVKHLKPGNSYAFVVRAENSKGIGPPSPISEMISTKASMEEDRMGQLIDLETARQKLASEQLIKLQEVKAINSTAMLLTWKRQRREPLVQGYYIKWRGPPLTPDHSWVNVTDSNSESVVINGLRPFNNYEFFVIPYHQSIQGMPSNSLDGTTHEAAPSLPPSDVRLRMLNLTSLRVSWRPPPADAINGILKGFLINIRSNMSEERNITTNERATSVTLYRLIPEASYAIRVAARTNANFGVFFNAEPVVMNEETLRYHLRQATEANNVHPWYKQPLSVLAIGFILWCILLLMIILLWYRCCHRRRKQMSTKEREFIKIRDGSVANTIARDAFWANHPSHTTQTLDSLGHQTSNSGGCVQDGYSDGYGSQGHCATLPQSLLYNMMHPANGPPANCSTLQRSGHSPPHHYHYCQLGEGHPHAPEAISTFHGQQYYDDPSPYATTTLVMGGSSTGQRPRRSQRNGGPATLRIGQGPVLPINPIPREPPRNFLSTQAVAAVHQGNRASLRLETSTSMDQHASCAALLELNSQNGVQCNGGSTAGSRMKVRRSVDRLKERSSSVNVESKTDNCVFVGGRMQQRDSPQTDVSYVQSSDNGTNGSNKVNGRSTPGNLLDLVPPPPRDLPPLEQEYARNGGCMTNPSADDYFSNGNVDYDPVAEFHPNKASIHSRMQKKGERSSVGGGSTSHRTKRHNKHLKNRVSMLENDERCEQDPLMTANHTHELSFEADGEMSEEENEKLASTSYSTEDYLKDRKQRECSYIGDQINANDTYFSSNRNANNSNDLGQSRPARQPLMGVSVSALHNNSNDASILGSSNRRSNSSKLKQHCNGQCSTDFV